MQRAHRGDEAVVQRLPLFWPKLASISFSIPATASSQASSTLTPVAVSVAERLAGDSDAGRASSAPFRSSASITSLIDCGVM